ncbi:hopanoid-associated sugar epimerase [Leptolyngbya sp. FACHB-17]|uniref:hopanoid-associated sugar epimerase n=1 Tax=unclassified Leptolyngbya TaxID=2650499 RepID=UPI00168036EE|nr:hopanoid-associated sugar epimerase [Leptolyngbya sp. FACHB-17]MBD2083012.1 NAD-dependent epimerase/dehydratase family protein [Leptolyngbya sp. FACHB-17]
MKAFVTGSTGFVGANLVRLMLEEGFEVRSLVRLNSRLDNLKGLEVEIVQGDLLDENLSELMRGCQVLFHVAAHYSLWQRDRAILYQSNVLGTRNVLAAARTAGIERSVYTSSVAAIGVDPSGQPTPEQYQSPVEKLIGHYKQSKYWAEQEAIKAVQSGQDVVIVNPSTPIGAYDIKPTPTGDIVLRFLQRRMPSYVETGLNLVHVRDVAWGHLLALQKGKTGDRYILGNQNLSLKQMLEELSQITGLSAPARSVPLWLPLTVAWIDEAVLTKFGKAPSIPIDGVRMSKQPMYYNPEKAIRELGLPQTPIRAALKDAVHWFQYIHQDT